MGICCHSRRVTDPEKKEIIIHKQASTAHSKQLSALNKISKISIDDDRDNEIMPVNIKRGSFKRCSFVQSARDVMVQEDWNFQKKRNVRETHIIFSRGAPGQLKFINQYSLQKILGKGSFGKVKLATRNILDKEETFAIKIFKKQVLKKQKEVFRDASGKIQFRNALQDVLSEIAIMKKLNHPNVIKLHEVIHDDNKDKLYMIMDFAENGQLIEWDEVQGHFYYLDKTMNQDEFIEEDQLREIFRASVKGLSYLHLNGIIHRDFKPQNVLFDKSGILKIADFGVAILFEPPTETTEEEKQQSQEKQPKRQLTKKPTMQIQYTPVVQTFFSINSVQLGRNLFFHVA